MSRKAKPIIDASTGGYDRLTMRKTGLRPFSICLPFHKSAIM
jgi:hypothetical protein